MVVAAAPRDESSRGAAFLRRKFRQQKRNGVQTKMPKTLPEKIIFTIIMAAIMVYGMIVYNVALATGGVTNATFGMALHEMPIMVPVAFVLEFFVVEKLATALAVTFRKPAVHHLCHLADDRLDHVPGDEPGGNAAVPGAELRHLGAHLGLQHAHGPVLADAVLWPAEPCHFPAAVPPQ